MAGNLDLTRIWLKNKTEFETDFLNQNMDCGVNMVKHCFIYGFIYDGLKKDLRRIFSW